MNRKFFLKKYGYKDVWIIGGGTSLLDIFYVPSKIVNRMWEKTINPFITMSRFMQPYFFNKTTIGVTDSGFLGSSIIDFLYFGDCTWGRLRRNSLQEISLPVVHCCAKYEKTPNWLYYKRSTTKEYGLDCTQEDEIVFNYNSGISALNIAAHLGAKRIFLLGFDMKHENNKAHWYDTYKEENLHNPPYEKYLAAFSIIQSDCEKLGIKVFNINIPEKTAITNFPIITFSEALEESLE